MAYNILGVNPGHNGSAALVSDGKVVYYLEEERLSRQKYDGNPFRAILDIISRWHVDEIVIGGTTYDLPKLPWTGEDPYTSLVRKFYPKVKSFNMGSEHHFGHAMCAFHNSGFDKCLIIVVDGAGSYKQESLNEEKNIIAEGFETESIWVGDIQTPQSLSLVYKVYGNNIGTKLSNGLFDFDNAVTLTKAYEAVSEYLGFGFIEAGKTMGLAPYGKKDQNVPNLFINNRGSKDVFVPNYPAGAFIDQNRLHYFRQERNPREWHNDADKLTEKEKNLAWQIQHETQTLLGSYVEHVINATGINKVAIVGGYGLNCVANYYLLKRFPNVEFYCESIAHDGGTAIGLALHRWNQNDLSKDFPSSRQTSIYYGPQYDNNTIEKVLHDNSEKINVKKVTSKEVAKLIAEKNIVSIFQGRSEAGPRALGNRSILYDPRDVDGKDVVNKVKGREWFRPFAGTVLKEHADDWFDMAGLEESPFMMYAVNVAADKTSLIPSITHVDDTCRVQTVTQEQNEHFYDLINEFYKITEVPILFNTSFNLAGEPLVETIDDALSTLYRSELKYLYLPELNVLVTKTIENPKIDDEIIDLSVE